jgi:hypothetical protein
MLDLVDRLIVEVAHANPTDRTRMVAALTSQELGRQINRKRPNASCANNPAATPLAASSLAASRLLPGRAARPALAPRHDQRLGRRARLVLLERRDRLLHP